MTTEKELKRLRETIALLDPLLADILSRDVQAAGMAPSMTIANELGLAEEQVCVLRLTGRVQVADILGMDWYSSLECAGILTCARPWSAIEAATFASASWMPTDLQRSLAKTEEALMKRISDVGELSRTNFDTEMRSIVAQEKSTLEGNLRARKGDHMAYTPSSPRHTTKTQSRSLRRLVRPVLFAAIALAISTYVYLLTSRDNQPKSLNTATIEGCALLGSEGQLDWYVNKLEISPDLAFSVVRGPSGARSLAGLVDASEKRYISALLSQTQHRISIPQSGHFFVAFRSQEGVSSAVFAISRTGGANSPDGERARLQISRLFPTDAFPASSIGLDQSTEVIVDYVLPRRPSSNSLNARAPIYSPGFVLPQASGDVGVILALSNTPLVSTVFKDLERLIQLAGSQTDIVEVCSKANELLQQHGATVQVMYVSRK